MKRLILCLLLVTSCLAIVQPARAGEAEFVGKFEPQLAANQEDLERVVFKPARDLARLKLPTPIDSSSDVTVGWLYDARSDKSAIQTLLVDSEDATPYLLAD